MPRPGASLGFRSRLQNHDNQLLPDRQGKWQDRPPLASSSPQQRFQGPQGAWGASRQVEDRGLLGRHTGTSTGTSANTERSGQAGGQVRDRAELLSQVEMNLEAG